MKDLVKFNLVGGETLVLSPNAIVCYYPDHKRNYNAIIEVGTTPLTHTVRESVQEINQMLRSIYFKDTLNKIKRDKIEVKYLKGKFSLYNYMYDILYNFYEENDLELMCAFESLEVGNYDEDNAKQLEFLKRFCDILNKVEEREKYKNYGGIKPWRNI